MSDQRDLRSALRDADWEALLPRLAAYAAQRLRRVGWPNGEDTEPSAMSVEHVVNLAVERCLNGDRAWGADAPADLEVFLRGVIKSLVSSAKKSAVRRMATITEGIEADAPSDSLLPDEGITEAGRSAICDAFESCVSGDSKLEDMYLAISVEGHTKREDLAEALGWSMDDVTAARVKLQRRLVSQFPKLFSKARKRKAS